jgi:type III pantothenate kinase
VRLLLDLGNTRAKWAWLRADGLQRASAVAWRDAGWADTLVAAWAQAPAPAAVWIAAVAPQAQVDELMRRIDGLWPGVPVRQLVSPQAGGGIVNAYAAPERLGVDRFLAMVAARARAATPAVVAGFGTAVAVDVIDGEGRHLGGVIAPSPDRMQQTVLASTARVLVDHPAPAGPLGTSTEQALASGCWLAVAALVDRVAADATADGGPRPEILLHGGDAPRVAPLLRVPCRIVPDLVLEGLATWVDHGA